MTESFNFSRFQDDSFDSWESLYNYNESYIDNLLALTERFIAYPDSHRQIPLLLSYAMMPSALAKIAPILMVVGQAGTGKSLTGMWVSKIRGMPIFTGADTVASLRNSINELKFWNDIEQNVCFIWDDIDPDVFRMKPDIYRILKSGYNRSSDTISIASQKAGQVIKFRTFSTKIASTIHPIYAMPEFGEIARRCMIIKTAKLEALGVSELDDMQLINWKNFANLYDKFWNDEGTCLAYLANRKVLARKKVGAIPSDKWILSLDLLATGITIGLWDTSKAIDFCLDYWNWHNEMTKDDSGALKGLLEQLIRETVYSNDQIYEKTGIRLPTVIPPNIVNAAIRKWSSMGALEVRPEPRIISQVMGSLGFKLTVDGWVESLS